MNNNQMKRTERTHNTEKKHGHLRKGRVLGATIIAASGLFVTGNGIAGAAKGFAEGTKNGTTALADGVKNIGKTALGTVDPVQNAKNHGDEFETITVVNSGKTPQDYAKGFADDANMSADDTLSAIDAINGINPDQYLQVGQTIQVPVHYNVKK
jgi:hypothetical protein